MNRVGRDAVLGCTRVNWDVGVKYVRACVAVVSGRVDPDQCFVSVRGPGGGNITRIGLGSILCIAAEKCSFAIFGLPLLGRQFVRICSY